MTRPKQTTLRAAADDPQPTLTWEVVYTDTFDRRAPPSIDVAGAGLVPGLVELWARYLFESVKASGRGFSRFCLATSARSQISIDGDFNVARRLKSWVFGDATSSMGGVLDEANLDRLMAIARAHGRLLPLSDGTNAYLGGPHYQPIFDAVAAHAGDDLMAVLEAVGKAP